MSAANHESIQVDISPIRDGSKSTRNGPRPPRFSIFRDKLADKRESIVDKALSLLKPGQPSDTVAFDNQEMMNEEEKK